MDSGPGNSVVNTAAIRNSKYVLIIDCITHKCSRKQIGGISFKFCLLNYLVTNWLPFAIVFSSLNPAWKVHFLICLL